MNINLNKHLMVRIRYVFTQGNNAYYQRKIPLDVLDRYPGKTHIKLNLRTTDPEVIASKVGKLNKQYEAEWASLRRDPSVTVASVREEAKKLLNSYGVGDPRNADEEGVSHFFDRLEVKRQAHAETHYDPEDAYRNSSVRDYLSGPEVEAIRLLNTADKFLITDALELYLREHPKRGQPRYEKLEIYTRRVIDTLIEVIGDKPLEDVSREDAYRFRDALLAKTKTETASRNITVVRAVFSRCIAEKCLTIANVWQKLAIAGLGKDSNSRKSFKGGELEKLRGLCHEKDDEIRWLLAMILDTGARLGEVAGLALEDIHLEGEEVPYLDIRELPWRPLNKSEGSKRKVPLVGDALWGAKRLLEFRDKNQPYAFPRYILDGNCETNTPSATLNKFMRSNDIPHTVHELRHTMRDRLRNTGATRDIQDAVGGWGKIRLATITGRDTC